MADTDTRYNLLQARYNTGINTYRKTFLPIIGPEVPHKLLTYFDTDDVAKISSAGTGALSDVKTISYLGKSNARITLATDETETLTFTDTLDLTCISSSTNNYATIKETGLYGNDEDKLWFVLNTRFSVTGGVATMGLVFKNGTKTATLKTAYAPVIDTTAGWQNNWFKMQFSLDSTFFTYAADFAAADWASITSFDVSITQSGGAGAVLFDLQGAWIALPQVSSNRFGATNNDDVTNAYFPDVDASAIYVSWLFGADTNTGHTRLVPVKTIEKGITEAMADGETYVVILDSETYKPITANECGILTTLTANFTVVADYLETPVLSVKAGLLNRDRVGARSNYRTRWGTGDKVTVAKSGGDYTTIAAAFAAASASDLIEILDSGTYDETTLTIDKVIDIQAAPGAKPIWTNTAGVTTITINAQSAGLYGITFQGNGSGAEERITCAADSVKIYDCSFKGIGSTTSGTAISTTTAPVYVENCLFAENGAKFIAINKAANAGLVEVVNCIGYMQGNLNNYFVKALRATADNKYVKSFCNDIEGDVLNACCYHIYFGDSSANKKVDFYSLYNYLYCAVTSIIYTNSQVGNTTNFQGNECYNAGSGAIGYAGTCLYFGGAPNGNSTQSIKGNIFQPLTLSTNYAIAFDQVPSTATATIKANLFKGTATQKFGVCIYNYSTSTAALMDRLDYNIYYKAASTAAVVFLVSNNSGAVTMTGNIFVGNNAALAAVYPSGITNTNSIYYDNTVVDSGAGPVTVTNKISEDPGFIDPDNLDFSWSRSSPIETYNLWKDTALPLVSVVNGGAYIIEFKFMEFEGHYNKTAIRTEDAVCYLTNCKINDFCLGAHTIDNKAYINYCTLEDNGIAIRENSATVASTADLKYSIIKNNNTAVMLRAGLNIQYNTITGNGYGIADYFVGSYRDEDYLKDFLTIQNNIIYGNSVYDYHCRKATDYCIIGGRYYDALGSASTNYVNTTGTHDIQGDPRLTSDDFPATLYEGYKLASPAYLADSAGTGNIGARHIATNINAELTYNSYTFPTYGNPNKWAEALAAINGDETHTIKGVYDTIFDAIIKEYSLSWDAPGKDSKIKAAQKLVLEYIFKTSWIIGLSTDAGSTYTYYKVIIKAAPSFVQQGYYYSDLPWGNNTLKLSELLDSDGNAFDINDYIITGMV